MNSCLVFLFLFAVSVLAVDQEEQLFQKFITDFSKSYSTAEYYFRLKIFKQNLLVQEKLSVDSPLASFGINKFSDLSNEEFKAKYLMPSFDPEATCIFPYHVTKNDIKNTNIPSTYDWRTKGAVTPVKDQGQCGSCWAFSTTGNVEGQWQINNPQHTLVSLSEQWIVDCSNSCLSSQPQNCNSGCNGGLPWLAYQDIIKNKFITTETAYPYNANDNPCQKVTTFGADIYNWTSVESNQKTIAAFLVQNGPLSICLNADMLMQYNGGIITGDPSVCPANETDHAVLLVGYASGNGTNYWIVKNSWGEDWGENGYFRIENDNDLCGINDCVSSSFSHGKQEFSMNPIPSNGKIFDF